MTTLLLDRRDVELCLDNRRVLIREPDSRPRSVPLAMLERVVIQGRARLDTALLGALGEQGVDVLLLGARNSRRRGFLAGPGHNDARRRLAQYRLWQDEPRRLAWSRQLIQAKTRAQRLRLTRALQRRPDQRLALTHAIDTLAEIELDLLAAADRAVVLGLEGSAAAAYFRGYATLFAPALGFVNRRRRPPPDPVNACLSLGYTLLHHEAVRACHIAGLDPLLGFYHEPAYGRESLASDLIEPLRPRLDGWVWWLFRERVLRAELFTEQDAGYRLGKAARGPFFAAYESAARRWRRYLRLQGYRLARALLAQAPELTEDIP
ncbi:MAG: CRISPR-associated endonuclease Cas1 [Candidatus Competibacterales bacterium]|nr:CRISPR-associated endonuclease Cas1 [Candidatus Competibacterales bacterium]